MIEKLLSKGKKYDNMGMIEVGGGNMKRGKGFTLIELLAVIVILAIIALIATPIILNIINDSREKSNQRSVEGLGKAVETTIGEIMMDSDYTGSAIVCKLGSNISDGEMSKDDIDEGETYCWDINNSEKTIKKVTYSGSRVKAGSIVFDKETGKISIANAQVGSSSKKYSTESDDSLIVTITSLATKENEDWIFTDPYGNIRYRGANPNNYVTFNDELWRIIGIVDGKVKVVHERSIGYYAYDQNGKSNYPTSTIKNYLNGEYYNNINNIYQNMIDESIWYLGATGNVAIYAEDAYKLERGDVVYGNNDKTWIGKVGLMYPSDIGYAVDTTCTVNINSYEQCTSVNWIHKILDNGESIEFLITHNLGNNDSVNFYGNGGYIDIESSQNSENIRPTVYLKTSVKITNGEGTESSPYELLL